MRTISKISSFNFVIPLIFFILGFVVKDYLSDKIPNLPIINISDKLSNIIDNWEISLLGNDLNNINNKHENQLLIEKINRIEDVLKDITNNNHNKNSLWFDLINGNLDLNKKSTWSSIALSTGSLLWSNLPLAFIIATYFTGIDIHYNTVTICYSLLRLTTHVLNNKAAINKVETMVKQNVDISEQTLQTAQGNSVPPIETPDLTVSDIGNTVVESIDNEVRRWIA